MRGKMWFGTYHHAEWINCPIVGSDFSPRAWNSGGIFLSGGGHEVGSPDAHKEMLLAWSSASSIPEVAKMQAYRDGAYSQTPQDLFYFHDPLTYDRNILPKRWAQPSLLARSGRAVEEIPTPTPGARSLPLTGARIEGFTSNPSAPGPGVLYIPIPQGYTLRIGAVQTGVANPDNGMSLRIVSDEGVLSSRARIPDVPEAIPSTGRRGALVFCWGEALVYALRAVLYRTGDPGPIGSNWGWESGMGHSGARFMAAPTYVPSNGVSGGMASYAASFREVGDWIQ